MLACAWKKPWHRSSRNQREKLLAISRPVADWLRSFLPWPFLINGRICSVAEKPLPRAQALLASERDQLRSRSHCQGCFPFPPLHGRRGARGSREVVRASSSIWAFQLATGMDSSHQPSPHLTPVPFGSRSLLRVDAACSFLTSLQPAQLLCLQ